MENNFYENDNKIRPLFIKILQMVEYHDVYEKTDYINFKSMMKNH